MTPCIWTSLFHTLSPEEAVRRFHTHGWRSFELSTEHLDMLQDRGSPTKACGALRELLSDLDSEMRQAHAMIQADVAGLDDARREADLRRVLAQLEYCSELGVQNAVLHPGGYHAATREELAEQSRRRLESFARLAARAAELGVNIAIENMADGGRGGPLGRRRFGAVLDELLELIETVGSPALGICLDTSHANVQGIDQPDAIRHAGAHLFALHVSDNDTTGDQHRMPGYGTIDWPPIVTALREIEFPGPFNLEIPGENHPIMAIADARSAAALKVTQVLLAET